MQKPRRPRIGAKKVFTTKIRTSADTRICVKTNYTRSEITRYYLESIMP